MARNNPWNKVFVVIKDDDDNFDVIAFDNVEDALEDFKDADTWNFGDAYEYKIFAPTGDSFVRGEVTIVSD